MEVVCEACGLTGGQQDSQGLTMVGMQWAQWTLVPCLSAFGPHPDVLTT